jgi:hypothetical protein
MRADLRSDVVTGGTLFDSGAITARRYAGSRCKAGGKALRHEPCRARRIDCE